MAWAQTNNAQSTAQTTAQMPGGQKSPGQVREQPPDLVPDLAKEQTKDLGKEQAKDLAKELAADAGKTSDRKAAAADSVPGGPQSVELLTVVLLQDENETEQAVAPDKLEGLVKSVQAVTDNYLNGQASFDTKQLIVRCSIKPDGTQTFALTSKPGLSGRLTSGLDQALLAVPATTVKSPLNLEIIFSASDRQTKIGRQARRLVRAGKAAEAVELLAPQATEDCKNAFVWQQLGWAYCAKGDFPNAEKTLKRAIQLDSRDFDTWANLVSTYHSEGKVEEAEAAAKKNLDCAQSPDNTDIVNINSALYSGDWPKAETILRRQCEVMRDYAAPYQVILACALRWQGKNDEAKQLLETAMKKPLDDYYAKLAQKQLALLKGDWKLAEELGRNDLSKDPKDYESLYDMGIALKGEGKLDEARQAFEAAVQPVTPQSVLKAVDVQMKELPGAAAKSTAKQAEN
jgi:tetratricopeptide (TPR) repeat protein